MDNQVSRRKNQRLGPYVAGEIARFVAVMIMLSPPGSMAQATPPPTDSPPRGPLAEGLAPATTQPKDPSENVVKPGAPASNAKQSQPTDAQTQRVRELIYLFRNFRTATRVDEWAQTIRELATIGKAAVPELVAELDRTDRDATLRSLVFCLRAIGDPRAVPALIRAIPKTLRPPGSDCGINISDPELRKFMLAHHSGSAQAKSSYVVIICGRPVNEIFFALERITKHREPPDLKEVDPLRLLMLGGTPEEQTHQRASFERRPKQWQVWWAQHSKKFVTEEELRSVELPKRDNDLVELAGVARFGPLFPTGPHVRLGPVRMLRLNRYFYWDAKSHLDFDTGRAFSQYEGLEAADWGPPEFGLRASSWSRRNGIDVRCQGPLHGDDLQLWLIDDSRWGTLETEIQKGTPLELGREATSEMARFDETSTDFKYDELATFLFTTREGGQGIVQVFPKIRMPTGIESGTGCVRLPKRELAAVPPLDQPARETPSARLPGKPFAKIVTLTLELPAEGRECLLDLETGRKAVPAKSLKPDELANPWSLHRNEQFTRWRRDQGIDVFCYAAAAANPAGMAKAASGSKLIFSLIGLEMIERRILPQSFNQLTVEDARQILDRTPENKSSPAWMKIGVSLAEHPDTFAFKTREGTVGLLQIETVENEPGKLSVRYRLERRDRIPAIIDEDRSR